MERGPVGVIQPVTGVEREQFDLSPFGKCGRLVEHQAASVDPGFDRHEGRLAFDLLPNKRLQPAARATR